MRPLVIKKIKTNYIFIAVFFCLILLFISLSPNVLEMELKSDLGIDTYQVFFDVGNGFKERLSIKSRYTGNNVYNSVKFYGVPFQDLQSLRIDPGNKVGQIHIKSISVQYQFFFWNFKSSFYEWTGASLLKDFSPANDIAGFELSNNGELVIDIVGTDPFFTFSDDWQNVQTKINNTFLIHKIFICLSFLSLFFVLFVVFKKKEELTSFLLNRLKLRLGLKYIAILYEKIRVVDVKWPKLKELCVILLIVIMAMIGLGANPFKGETVAPTDVLLFSPTAAGFESVRNEIPLEKQYILNKARSDIIDSKIPAWKNFKRFLKAGEPMIWQPQSSGGSLGVQFIGREIFTPGFLMFIAFENDAFGFYMAMLINLIIAGVGAYLMARTILSIIPALFCAIIFMLSGPIAGWFFWPHVSTVIWLPWLYWATIWYFKNNNLLWLLLISVAGTLMIWGGFPAVAASGLYVFGIMVCILSMLSLKTLREKIVSFFLPFIAIGFSFVFSAVVLFSFIELNRYGNILGQRGGGTFFKGWKELVFFISTKVSYRAVYPEGVCYVGILAVIFCIMGVLAIRRKISMEMHRKLALFNIISIVSSLSIAFGLLPRDLILKIPTFNSNPWNRAVLVSVLPIAFLAGIGFDCFIKYFNNLIQKMLLQFKSGTLLKCRQISCLVVIFLSIVILSYQFIDQRSLFRQLNAVTPSEWFYPETETLRYVSNSLNDLQYVVADSSYFISGVISAYGISEWFAHGIHFEAEKALLNNLVSGAWQSKTAAIFNSNKIRFENEEFTVFADIMGIRYFLVNSETEVEKRLKTNLDKWNIFQLEKSIKIVERKKPVNGAYFVSNLKTVPNEDEWKNMTAGINTVVKKSTEIVVECKRERSGWIVFPMRAYPGWSAYIDGKEVSLDKYQNALPAIKIDGPCQIRYLYEPKSLKYGLFVSVLGGALYAIIVFSVVIYKRSKRPEANLNM